MNFILFLCYNYPLLEIRILYMITPMQKFKNHFSTLTLYTKGRFNFFSLNEAQEKSIPFPFQPRNRISDSYKTVKKSVSSDHIKVFKNMDTDVSFAFAFDFKDKIEDDWTITVSLKITENNDSIISSPAFQLEEFRTLINRLNKQFHTIDNSKEKNVNLSSDVILNLVSETFFDQSINLNNEIEKAESNIDKALEETKSLFEDKTVELNNAELELKNTRYQINKILESSPDYKKMKKLEKELAILKDSVNSQKNQLEKSFNIDLKLDNIKSIKDKLSYLRSKAQHIVADFKKSIPKTVSNKLKIFNLPK